MIDVIMPEYRAAFASELVQMHRDRREVFVDALGWDLPIAGSWLEVDAFDNDHCIYLLARDKGQCNHLGSVRLLPSSRPNMLARHFPHLVADAAVLGHDYWEISRLVTNPVIGRGTAALRIYRMLAVALVEFAELNAIARYRLVAEVRRVPSLLAMGWNVRPLGMPTGYGNDDVQALEIVIDVATMAAVRARTGLTGSMLRMPQPMRQAA